MNRNQVLLAYLEPTLRPVGGGEAMGSDRGKNVRSAGDGDGKDGGVVDVAGVGRFSFDHLITLAMRGELTTGRKVTVTPGINISITDLERIGAAADRVEAKGGKRAVVFIKGEGFVLDVIKRRVTEGMNDWDKNGPSDLGLRIVSGIDTAVILEGAEDGEGEGRMKAPVSPGKILAGLRGASPLGHEQ